MNYFINSREDIAKYVFGDKENDKINIPVGFTHIINNIQGQLYMNGNALVDLTPLEAINIIDDGYNQIDSTYFIRPTRLFKAMYYYYLNFKDLLLVKRFNCRDFEQLI